MLPPQTKTLILSVTPVTRSVTPLTLEHTQSIRPTRFAQPCDTLHHTAVFARPEKPLEALPPFLKGAESEP